MSAQDFHAVIASGIMISASANAAKTPNMVWIACGMPVPLKECPQ